MRACTKTKLYNCGLAAAGICSFALNKLCSLPGAAAVTTLIWLYAFLTLTYRCRTKKGLLLAAIPFTVSCGLICAGLLGTFWADLLLTVLSSMLLYAAFCLISRLMLRWNRFPVTLAAPLVWLGLYLLATALHAPALVRVDMMFADMTILIQAEHLIGAAGLSFMLIWIVSILRFAAANRKPLYAGLGGGLFLLLLIPGIISLYPDTQAAETVRTAYTTGPYIGDFLHYTDVSYEANEESMERAVSEAAQQGAEILVFTEEAFSLDDRDESRFLARCSELAEENNIAVLLGLDVADTDDSDGGRGANKAVLIDNSGEILGTYQKSRLIPILESDHAPGDGNIPSYCLTLGGKNVKISFLICYDSNFPGYIRTIDPDTDILFLLSWDWSAITNYHAKLCRNLAVENRLCILKPTYDGLSVAVDPYGQILSSSSTDTTGFEQIQLVDMPVDSSREVITRDSSLSPLICAVIGTEIMAAMICLLLLVVIGLQAGEKTKRSRWFTHLVAADLTGCCADVISWLLDGAGQLNSILYISTLISMIATLIMIGIFCSYLTEYIKERKQISPVPVAIGWIFSCVTVFLTLVFSFTGDLFTFENGVFTEGPMYSVYVFANALSMVLGIAIIFLYRRSLDRSDRIIAYTYMAIPVVMAVINLWIEDWSFAYSSMTFSLILVYIMLQSDKMDQLEQQGQIVGYHATHDALTGLFNRRAYNDRIAALAATEGSSGIIFGDLNGLKYTNDHFGHEAGDRLLVRYAEMLSDIFRASDLYRISGDEFICLLQDMPESSFEDRVHSLETALRQDEPPLACIGAAYGRNHEIESLMNDAEALMYAKKKLVHEQYPKIKR